MFCVKMSTGNYAFESIGENVIRTTCSKVEIDERYSALGLKFQSDGSDWQVKKEGKRTVLRWEAWEITIDREEGKIEWKNRKTGENLFSEKNRRLNPIPIVRTSIDGQISVVKKIKTVDGERTVVENIHTYVERTAYQGELVFTLPEGTAIHGLGQGEDGVYDYRNHLQYLYQHNMRIPIPFLVTDRGFGILFDCGSPMVVESLGNTLRVKL